MRHAVILACAFISSLHAVELPSRHHPVGVAVPETMQLDAGLMPDAQGRLGCATCHGLADMENRPPEDIETSAADFLHGGPYRPLEDFCFRCHDAEPYRRLNIHAQVDAAGSIDESSCEYCHREIPDRDRPLEAEDLRLRLPTGRICLGCHLLTPHLNALEHRGKPNEAYLKRIQAAELERGIKLPLDADGRLTCITCHSPHEAGVISEEFPGAKQVSEPDVEQGPEYRESRWAPIFAADKQQRLDELAARLGRLPVLRYRRLSGEVLLRLPAKTGGLCLACHEFEN